MTIAWKIDVVTPQLRYEKRRLRMTMRAAGNEIAAVTRSLIKSGGKSGRFYRKPGGGTYQASAAGQAAASRTGSLAAKIKVRVFAGGLGVDIREQARYAWILEHGRNSPARKQFRKQSKAAGGKLVQVGMATRMEPRPSISEALEMRGPSIVKRIQASVALDIAFVRVKPGARP